jgi:ferric-dicitrate binding protein FerR (iron transport regulator)
LNLAIPRIPQQLLAAVLIALLASPAWSQTQVAGTVVTSQAATMRDAPLPPGSTIFSGESVSVGQTGGAQLTLAGGGRIEVLRDSAVQLNRNPAGVQFVVLRGAVSFMGEPKDAIATTLGDAAILSGDPSSRGVLHLENPDSAVLATLRGKLTIKTEHDASSVDVPEGSAVRITLVDPSEPQGGAQPAGRAAPAIKKLALIVFLFAAAFLAVFLWIAAHEPSETPQQLASEVSPFRVQ